MNDSLQSLKKTTDKPPESARRPMPAWLIPALIVLGFALLFLLLFRDRILPATDVKVALVLSTPINEESTPEATAEAPPKITQDAIKAPMAFQASGWVEPDPLPILATALTDGVVEQVHVLEGEDVTKGQLLANLISEDRELQLKTATSTLAMRRAALVAQKQSVEAAKAKQEAQAALVNEAADRQQRIEGLPAGAMAETELTTIRSAWKKALAGERASAADVAQMAASLAVLESEIQMAQVAVDTAQLALERTKILSPIDGRVLQLHAAPGKKKMLGMDNPDSATIAVLYQPEKLQVRVDVPLADAGALQIGQLARIKCNLLPDTTFYGEVTRITGEADIARNTLQAKVRIDKPSDQLRPEMLCRVEFLESRRQQQTSQSSSSHGSLAIWAPQSAITNNTAWVCDPQSKRLEQRQLTTGPQTRDGYLRITQGLMPGEWVVISPSDGLKQGQRVNPNSKRPPTERPY